MHPFWGTFMEWLIPLPSDAPVMGDSIEDKMSPSGGGSHACWSRYERKDGLRESCMMD